MYIPPHFREAEQNTLLAFIEAYDFATLVTYATEGRCPMHSHRVLTLSPARQPMGAPLWLHAIQHGAGAPLGRREVRTQR